MITTIYGTPFLARTDYRHQSSDNEHHDEDNVPEAQGENTSEACFSDREEEKEVIASSKDTDTDQIDENENGADQERITGKRQLVEGNSAAKKPVVSPELSLFLSQLVHSFKYEFAGFRRKLAQLRYQVDLMENSSPTPRGEKHALRGRERWQRRKTLAFI